MNTGDHPKAMLKTHRGLAWAAGFALALGVSTWGLGLGGARTGVSRARAAAGGPAHDASPPLPGTLGGSDSTSDSTLGGPVARGSTS